MKEIYHYGQWQDLPLHASFYPATNREKGLTLLYFHGGGLIYGNRDDLPRAYIEQLNRHGYHLLTFDYPLAPEAPLSGIVESLTKALNWFNTNYQASLGLTSPDYCLFGRSAGAYLSLLLASQITDANLKGVVSFYGYYDLAEPAFNQASPYYQQYPAIPYMTLYQLTQGPAKSQAAIAERFPIYLAYRQTGQWVKQLLGKAPLADYSLREEQLQQLPPTFLAASTGDQDVPYAISDKMVRLLPAAHFYRVSGLPHDFDADSTQPAGYEAYEALCDWLAQF